MSVVCVCVCVYGEGDGNPLQYSCLENPMNRGTWWATVQGVAQESDTTWDYTTTMCICVCGGFPGGSVVKNLLANAGGARDSSLIPGLGRSPGGGHGNPLHSSCQWNLVDREAQWPVVHEITESDMNEQLGTQHIRTCTQVYIYLCIYTIPDVDSMLFY